MRRVLSPALLGFAQCAHAVRGDSRLRSGTLEDYIDAHAPVFGAIRLLLLPLLPVEFADSLNALARHVAGHPEVAPHSRKIWSQLSESQRGAIKREVRIVARTLVAKKVRHRANNRALHAEVLDVEDKLRIAVNQLGAAIADHPFARRTRELRKKCDALRTALLRALEEFDDSQEEAATRRRVTRLNADLDHLFAAHDRDLSSHDRH